MNDVIKWPPENLSKGEFLLRIGILKPMEDAWHVENKIDLNQPIELQLELIVKPMLMALAAIAKKDGFL